MSCRLPWLLVLPLMTAGCLGAHSVAYRLVEPEGAEAAHGYLALAPFALAVGLALGAAAAVRSAFTGRTQASGPLSVFALLPPLAFTLQEHLEEAFLAGALPLDTALEPAFLVGLVLQLPFALAALVVARALLRAADAVGGLICRRQAARLRPPTVLRPAFVVDTPRPPALSSLHAGRAPPPPA
jgi:hypothetical protein